MKTISLKYYDQDCMYKKTKYSIKVKDGYLDPISSNLDLRQGCPLSPILFNIYIENINDSFDDTCDPVTIDDIKKLNHFYMRMT